MLKETNVPYQLFTQRLLDHWVSLGVEYLSVEELSEVNNITFFELIPNSHALDRNDLNILYPIHSADVAAMLSPSKTIMFVVHNIYLFLKDSF